MKFAMTDVSGLKTFDAPGFGTLLIVCTSVSALWGCSLLGGGAVVVARFALALRVVAGLFAGFQALEVVLQVVKKTHG